MYVIWKKILFSTLILGSFFSDYVVFYLNNVLVPNFLALVLKKQEISQQVMFHNFHLIGFFGSNNQGRNHCRKVEILELSHLSFARIYTS